MAIAVRTLSSLEKVFADEELTAEETASLAALRGERVSFQIACRALDEERVVLRAHAQCALSVPVELYEVGLVPVTLPCYRNPDGNYLRTTPGLYPDPLYPHREEMRVVAGQWRCLWVSLTVPEDAPAGDVPVRVRLFHADTLSGQSEEELAEVVFRLHVLPASLPPQTLTNSGWFHVDCLATWYRVPVFSEEHWAILGSYMRNAAAFGINLLLTPVFTPPLDTQVGGERPTAQLVDVYVQETGYRFGFDKLDRYMALAEDCGISQFEISHLFTQWGAGHAPKIMGLRDGREERLFGWETDAASPAYEAFLRAFLRARRAHLDETGRLARCYFHLSDEPSLSALDSYARAAALLREELEGCSIIDALSDYAFYEKGLLQRPVPSIDHLAPFLDHGVRPLWTYTCCAQSRDVSNRFMAMPSCRTRILGTQLYLYRIEGFLQWGYNFWYSQYSRHAVDPYRETGAEDAFPAGDAYLVYPGPDGQPVPSIRQFVFFEGLQDLRALSLLETALSREETAALVEAEEPVTLTAYPCTAEKMLDLRRRINDKIEELFGA